MGGAGAGRSTGGGLSTGGRGRGGAEHRWRGGAQVTGCSTSRGAQVGRAGAPTRPCAFPRFSSRSCLWQSTSVLGLDCAGCSPVVEGSPAVHSSTCTHLVACTPACGMYSSLQPPSVCSITIDAPGVGSTQLSLQDIRTEFKAHTFCSVLQWWVCGSLLPQLLRGKER